MNDSYWMSDMPKERDGISSSDDSENESEVIWPQDIRKIPNIESISITDPGGTLLYYYVLNE